VPELWSRAGPPRIPAVDQSIGIIDLGTNTARLMVLRYAVGGPFERVAHFRERVRIGEGMGASNALAPAPVTRALAALRKFKAECDAAQVGRIEAVATSAVRESSNREAFLALARKEAGLALRILSGDEEARAGFLGAVNALPIENGSVVDLGGGSVQVTEVRGRQMGRAASFPLGAVRLTEMFLPSDPPRRDEVQALDAYVQKAVGGVPWHRAAKGSAVCGVGGTVRALAKLDRKAREWPLDRLHGYELRTSALDDLVGQLSSLSLADRQALPGLRKERADIILAGAVTIRRILRSAGYDRIWVSADGLREGLFYPFLVRTGVDPVIPTVREMRVAGVRDLARAQGLDLPHGEQVAALAVRLFDALQPLLPGAPSAIRHDRELLEAAGWLVDLPEKSGPNGFLELIEGAPLPGLLHRHAALLALLLHPNPDALAGPRRLGALLLPGAPDRTARLGLLVALAEALDAGRAAAVARLEAAVDGGRVRLALVARGDARREIARGGRLADTFRKTFGKALELACD
jgi:exopolyphosphatase/guanosine-5'-triphosphate,3'-diphosphate pyrophosphatase